MPPTKTTHKPTAKKPNDANPSKAHSVKSGVKPLVPANQDNAPAAAEPPAPKVVKEKRWKRGHTVKDVFRPSCGI